MACAFLGVVEVGSQCGGKEGYAWTLSLNESQQPLPRRSSVLENREDRPAYLEVVGGKGEAQTCGT